MYFCHNSQHTDFSKNWGQVLRIVQKFVGLLVFISLTLTGCSASLPTAQKINNEGDTCFTLGKTVDLPNTTNYLECRYVTKGDLEYVRLTGQTEGKLRDDLENIDLCKLQDQRPTDGFASRLSGQNTAFPLTNTLIPPTGNMDIGIIPIDFSDSPATKSVDDVLSTHLSDVDDWLDFTTAGVTTYSWHMPKEWIRMPLESNYYTFGKQNIASDGSYVTVEDQLQSTEDITSQIFTEAEKYMNLDEIDYFWIVLPPTTTNVDWTVNGNRLQVLTPTGIHFLTFYSIANILWNEHSQQAPMYGTILHEMLHAHGATQHAPGNEYALHVGNSIGSVMGAWDSFIMGWRPDEVFACIDSTKLKSIDINLTPLDHKESGYKAAIIKLSDKEVIVVESRRKGPFSYKWLEGTAFVTAYTVDSSKLGLRFDGDNSRVKDYFSYYLEINEKHDDWIDLGQPFANMNGPDTENFAVRHVAFEGDVFEYGGISIEVIEQRDTDTVRISKIG